MVPELIVIGVVLLIIATVISDILSWLFCCRDDGFNYKNVPLEEVNVVSESFDDDRWTTKNSKQPSAGDTIIDIPSETNSTVSPFVCACASCSRVITTTYDPEISLCHECRFKLYSSIALSTEAKREVSVGCSKASLDHDIYTQCKSVVITALKTLLKHSRNGGRFSQKPDREGSTKSGLKTRKPVEFDFSVKVILHDDPTFVPRADIGNENKYRQWEDGEDADNKKTHMGCAAIRLGPRDERRFKECCVKGILSPTKLRLNFKAFLSSAIKHSNLDGVKVVVQTEMNGPAVRLVLQAKNHGISHNIDIDVTPKVVWSSDVYPKSFARGFKWPRNSTYRFLTDNVIKSVEEQNLYFVPKSGMYWCLSFANYENEILQIFRNSSVEKKIIRCMKVKLEAWQAQSKGNLNQISSYLLKTRIFVQVLMSQEVFFWLRENMPEDRHWTIDKCAERYYNFVMELKLCFANGHLPSYFVPTINLLEGKEKSRALMAQYLDEELKKIR